jgi:hypothetical protein
MTRKLRPLAALAMVALIGVISAGCGSHEPSETAANTTGTVSSTGAASSTGTAGNTGTASSTGTASNKRGTGQETIASPSSAALSPSPAGLPRSPGSPPSRAGSLPARDPRSSSDQQARPREPLSPQSTPERRRHE